MECNQNMDLCPFCRQAWGNPSPQLQASGWNIEELLQVVEEVEEEEAAAMPILDPPGFVQEWFGQAAEAYSSYDDAEWWLGTMPLGVTLRVPWPVYEELAGHETGEAWRLGHQAWARRSRYNGPNGAEHPLDVIQVVLFCGELIEREWDVERIVYE